MVVFSVLGELVVSFQCEHHHAARSVVFSRRSAVSCSHHGRYTATLGWTQDHWYGRARSVQSWGVQKQRTIILGSGSGRARSVVSSHDAAPSSVATVRGLPRPVGRGPSPRGGSVEKLQHCCRHKNSRSRAEAAHHVARGKVIKPRGLLDLRGELGPTRTIVAGGLGSRGERSVLEFSEGSRAVGCRSSQQSRTVTVFST